MMECNRCGYDGDKNKEQDNCYMCGASLEDSTPEKSAEDRWMERDRG